MLGFIKITIATGIVKYVCLQAETTEGVRSRKPLFTLDAGDAELFHPDEAQHYMALFSSSETFQRIEYIAEPISY